MKRRSVRFISDPVPYAAIDTAATGEFEPTISGLVFSESFTGCGVVSITEKLSEGQNIQIQINDHPIAKGKVVWVKTQDDGIVKIGIQYL